MKANRAFKSEDEAVSPVIAVILMVAITVVLAATVYVWVSGFGQSGSQAKNLSVTQMSCTPGAPGTGTAKFSVVSVSPNFEYTNLNVKDATTSTITLAFANTGTIGAGDSITLTTGGSGTFACTDTLNWVDKASNTVVSSITLHS